MSTRIDSAGNVYQLDRQAEPDEVVTEADAQDPRKLSRLLMRLLKDIAGLRRLFKPKQLDREDFRITYDVATYRIPHGFNSRVHWWIAGWRATSESANFFPLLMTSTASDLNTLVLTNVDIAVVGRFDGIATIHIESVG